VGRNRVFYGGALTPATYEHWLRENAVALVALPRSEPLDPAGVRERRLIGGRLPYLRLSWSSSDWQLYAVRDAEPLAAGGARLISSDAAGVTFDTDRPGRVLVRLRFSRWMTLSGPVGACIGRQHGWTSVSVAQAGRYRISSAWQLRPDRRC
jgi:hypothetical protein